MIKSLDGVRIVSGGNSWLDMVFISMSLLELMRPGTKYRRAMDRTEIDLKTRKSVSIKEVEILAKL